MTAAEMAEKERQAGLLLAQGAEVDEIAALLGLEEDRLVERLQSERLQEGYHMGVKLREMQNYGAALEWLAAQMREESGTNALKAVHEVISTIGQPREEGDVLRMREAAEGEETE